MKPKIDLKNPLVQEIIRVYESRATIAHRAGMDLEESVHPLYIKKEGEKNPQHTGSCVILEIKDQVFLLSAAHVFEPFGSNAILVGCGTKLHPLTGDRFSTKKGPSGTHIDDMDDAAVFYITCEIPPEISSVALSVANLDLSPVDYAPTFHAAIGYRASRSKSTPLQASSRRDIYPSCECPQSEYDVIGVDRNRHVILGFEDEVLINGNWQPSPSIKGMSGGGIFRVPSLHPDPWLTEPTDAVARLTAIITERRKKNGKHLSIMVGARVGFHLGLINKYLPGLI